jgi:hypothetical protein
MRFEQHLSKVVPIAALAILPAHLLGGSGSHAQEVLRLLLVLAIRSGNNLHQLARFLGLGGGRQTISSSHFFVIPLFRAQTEHAIRESYTTDTAEDH